MIKNTATALLTTLMGSTRPLQCLMVPRFCW